jgi:hypothetical protein
MGHHVRYLLSFRSITAVIVLTDGGLDVGACAVGGRTNHTCSYGKPIKKKKKKKKETPRENKQIGNKKTIFNNQITLLDVL